MNENTRFLIIGGDKRQIYLANVLSKEGFTVNTYGIQWEEFNKKIYQFSDLFDAIENADVLIGPLPFSTDGENINCKFFNQKISIEEILKLVKSNQKVFGGMISSPIKELSKKYNVTIYDFFKREEFEIFNCIPTAEGAIKIAIEEVPVTIHGSNCLILGFGRIGKTLSKMLLGIGANVYVEARKQEDLAWIKSYGYKDINLKNLSKYIGQFDMIFNTIPSLILNEELLGKVKKECLIIDLASKPGGTDFETANKLGIKTNWALSLPGKVAPQSAAQIIKDTVFNIIQEMEV